MSRSGPTMALFLAVVLAPPALAAWPPWKVGIAKISITPRQSLSLAGYGSRTKPSDGTLQELYAKVLALEDQTGRRAVLVTADLLGLPAAVSTSIAQRVEKKYKLPRDRVLFNASHTHGGPVVDQMLTPAYDMTLEHWAAVASYTRELENKIVTVIGAAVKDLQPARLSFGPGEATFAVNRRTKTDKGFVIGVNKEGPVDHTVPVLRIESRGGRIRAIVFGYACHNTTVGTSPATVGPDFYKFHGDYAGFAQAWLESRHAGAVAFFVEGCGADANPYPRGSVALARQHGEELATVVDQALQGSLKPIRPPLKTAFEVFTVAFATPPSRQELQRRLQAEDVYTRRHAQEMLKILDRDGRLPTDYPYPLQVWKFASDLTLIALAGEVVVDYALRLKKELGPETTWVCGYNNDVFAYIPSLRVLQEGGYEGGEAMKIYGQPAPFAPTIEETIIQKVHEMVDRLRR